MKSTRALVLASIVALTLSPAINAQELTERNKGFYIGGGFGPTSIEPDSAQRSVEGINFNFNTDDDDLGQEFHLGYWINPYFGIELGFIDLGSVNVGFDFSDPRNGSSGTGESEVEVSGGTVNLIGGFDQGPFQFFAKVGAFSWDENFETRFDSPGSPSAQRSFSESGTGISYGGGIKYNFTGSWSLRGEASFFQLDDDDANMFSLGLEYDFTKILSGMLDEF